MNGKTLYVTSELSNAGMVRCTLHNMKISEEVVYCPIDLSCGYLPKDFSDKELCFAVASQSFVVTTQGRTNLFDELKKFVSTDYSVYDKIIVWHGWSAQDLMTLYLMSVLVERNLYHIDMKDCSTFMSNMPSTPFPGMGYVSPCYMQEIISLAKPVSAVEKQKYQRLWHKWIYSKHPYRFSDLQTGVIKGYPESFMDKTIYELSKTNPSIMTLTARVMEEYYHLSISDSAILGRILELSLRKSKRLSLYVSRKNERELKDWV